MKFRMGVAIPMQCMSGCLKDCDGQSELWLGGMVYMDLPWLQ